MANRLRQKGDDIPGLRVFFYAMQDVQVGGRQSDSTYQFTLWDTDSNELCALGAAGAGEDAGGAGTGRCID